MFLQQEGKELLTYQGPPAGSGSLFSEEKWLLLEVEELEEQQLIFDPIYAICHLHIFSSCCSPVTSRAGAPRGATVSGCNEAV